LAEARGAHGASGTLPPRLSSALRPRWWRSGAAGSIPAIVDDGFALAESLAINLYLAKKYGSGGAQPRYPEAPEGEAEAWRWTLWAQGHLEPWVQRDALLAGLRAAVGEDLAPTSHVRDWLAHCYARPAAVATRQRFAAHTDAPRRMEER
jgi:glutathione S-transferase